MRLLFFLLLLPALAMATVYQRFEINGKVGVKDDQGKVVLPASFDALGWSDGQFSFIGDVTGYRKNGQWGLLNLRKILVTPAVYESITSGGGDRIIVSKKINPYTTKFGCIDLQGKVVVPFTYDEIILNGMRATVMIKNGSNYDYGLIDINDKSILPVKYRRIKPLGSLRYAVTNSNNKQALCSENGEWITEFVIDSISAFHFDLAIFHQGWQKGLIDRNGEIKTAPRYREIVIDGPDQIKVRQADTWLIRQDNFDVLHRLEADDLMLQPSGLNVILLNGKYGLVNDKFETIVPAVYDLLQLAGPNILVARKNKKYGLMHRDQSTILSFEFDSLKVTGHTVRAFRSQQWSLYDTVGICKTHSWYERMDAFNGKFFPVRQRGFWGGVDPYGQEIIACVYDSIFETRDEACHVLFKGHHGIVDTNDHWVVLPGKEQITLLDADHYLLMQDSMSIMKDQDGNILYFTSYPLNLHKDYLEESLPDGRIRKINFQGQEILPTTTVTIPAEEVYSESEGLTRIRRNGKFGFVDQRGRLRIANRYEDAGEFHEGLAAIRLLGKWGFIDASDQIVIQPTYDHVTAFSNSQSTVMRGGKYGLINSDGKIRLEVQYDSVYQYGDTYYMLVQGKSKGLASLEGRLLIEPRFDELQLISGNRVIVRQRDQYGILTTDGMSVVPINYGKLEFDFNRKVFLTYERSAWEEVRR